MATEESLYAFSKGKGSITTKSGVLDEQPYGFGTRFEGLPGTNPEELIAAAHAACFTMALSFGLARAGYSGDTLETSAAVTLEQQDGGFTITRSALVLTGNVPGIAPDEFAALEDLGHRLGFQHVASGPLVRSSYHADQMAHAAGYVDVA